MKLNTIYTFLIMLGAALVGSCSSNNLDDSPKEHVEQLRFRSSIVSAIHHNSGWVKGDKIGVYVIRSGVDLSSQDILYNANNIAYETDGSGNFTSTSPIIMDGVSQSDIVAYYPYQNKIVDFKIPLDVSNQASITSLDFLYADNIRQNSIEIAPLLLFKHSLSKLVLVLTADRKLENWDLLKPKSLMGLSTSGTVNLVNGNVTNTSISNVISNIGISGFAEKKVVEVILLPHQNMNSALLEFDLEGEKLTWLGKNLILEPGKQYTYNLEVKVGEDIPELVDLSASALIEDWDLGYIQSDSSIIYPEESKERLLFLETYDKEHKVEKDINNKYPKISEFDKFDNKNIRFSDSTGNVDIRSTKAYPNFVWFPSNRTSELLIEGLDLKNLNSVRMLVKVTIDINNKKGNFDVQNLKLDFDGRPFNVPSKVLTDNETNNNKFYTLEYNNLPGSFHSVRFYIDSSENHGIRIGNISIFGVE